MLYTALLCRLFPAQLSITTRVYYVRPKQHRLRLNMGWKCCVPLCRSGYKTNIHVQEKVSFYAFPTDNDQKIKWLRSIKRADLDKFGIKHDYVPTESSRVCSRHFCWKDFIRESCDTNVTRLSKRHRSELKILQFKLAIPSIFEDYPTSDRKSVV